MQADDRSELSPNMTVSDMLQAVVTEDDYKRWRKENGIGEKKKKKKKMPRKGLNELKSENSDDSEKNAQKDGRMSWADIIELEEGDSQSDDSADLEIAWSETRRSPSPDRANLDRRNQTKAVTAANAMNGSCQNVARSKDGCRTKDDTTVKADKRSAANAVNGFCQNVAGSKDDSRTKEDTTVKADKLSAANAVNRSCQNVARSKNSGTKQDTTVKAHKLSERDTAKKPSESETPSPTECRTKEDTTFKAHKLSERDTAKKPSESETPSCTESTTNGGTDKVHAPMITRTQQEISKKSASLTSGTENNTSAAGESKSETAQSITTTEDCQRKGTRKSGQARLTAEQHAKLQDLRRRFSSIPPLTWQRLRAVLENHPAMLDMQHDHTLTFLSQQPPRVMSKAVDNLRKDCYQKMRNPWNFLQALTETAAREYISQSVYNGAV